jgi:DNA repair protein RecO (recombination protein O)
MLFESQAIILAGQKLGEADTLVTLLTLDHGLLKGVARGARGMKSRFGSALQPFSYGHAILFGARTGVLRRVNQVDAIHSFRALREDYDRLTWAAAMANAARALLPEEQASRETFALLLRAFQALEAGGDDGGGARWFFVPHLGGTVCASCHGTLDREAGPIGRPSAWSLSPGTHAFLRQVLRLPPALRDRLKPDTAVLTESRRLLDACIADRSRRVVKRPIPASAPPLNVRARFDV